MPEKENSDYNIDRATVHIDKQRLAPKPYPHPSSLHPVHLSRVDLKKIIDPNIRGKLLHKTISIKYRSPEISTAPDMNSTRILLIEKQRLEQESFDPSKKISAILSTNKNAFRGLMAQVTAKVMWGLIKCLDQPRHANIFKVETNDDLRKLELIPRAKNVVNQAWLDSLSEKPSLDDQLFIFKDLHLHGIESDSVCSSFPSTSVHDDEGGKSEELRISTYSSNFGLGLKWILFENNCQI